MNLDQAVHKAALLLDLKDDRVGAEVVLREALSAHPQATASRVTVLVMLAELVHGSRPDEAMRLAKVAASMVLPEDAEAVAAVDRTRARELLASLSVIDPSDRDAR